MNISYYVLDPTSNITILAETPVPVELQPSVASRLMLAEQRNRLGSSAMSQAVISLCGWQEVNSAEMRP